LPRPVHKSTLGLAALATVALLAAGCGTGGLPSKTADVSKGRQLFVRGEAGKPSCGSCHTLADAGTTGTIGPNLDDAFGPGRAQGFKDSTIAAIVADQIRYPNKQQMTKIGGVMPANLVTGDDVSDVADYVASVAGLPTKGGGGGGKVTAKSGKQIFLTAGCTGCHTLANAGSHGTIGPNLDQAKPPKALVVTRVTNGRGAMPSFKGKLTPQQIQAVAQYVSSAAGT
jgi:cbb3-type cytochrome c oxidase subunit III